MNTVFQKLAKAEQDFKNSEFVAPIISDRVNVRIAGIISQYAVRPSDFRGWAVLRPMANKLARVVGEPSRSVKNEYLEIMPKFTFMVCDTELGLGICVNSDDRIPIIQPLPIKLLENAQLFDAVDVRFDGLHFLYDSPSRS